jgi:stress response protein YsnF
MNKDLESKTVAADNPATDNIVANPAAGIAVPVTREEVEVTTRVVDTGRGVRVSKTVTEQPEEVRETLWHETVDVRRVPVDRVVAEAPPSRYEGDVLVVPVLEEILVVEKRYRIREELHITRVRQQHEHRETVPLRVEDVRVEAFDDGPAGSRHQSHEEEQRS